MHQARFEIATRGRGTLDISAQVTAAVRAAGITTGLAHVFVHHTSASLLITENADPAVHRDLERVLARLAPDGDPAHVHSLEGPDDMPAHIRSVLTCECERGVCVRCYGRNLATGRPVELGEAATAAPNWNSNPLPEGAGLAALAIWAARAMLSTWRAQCAATRNSRSTEPTSAARRICSSSAPGTPITRLSRTEPNSS